MRFIETPLVDVYMIELEPKEDERGSFARLFCTELFSEKGLEPQFVQANLSTSKRKGTLRGMHYQLHPAQEAKLIKCSKGSLFDVVVDLRPNSKTFCKWFGEVLSSQEGNMMYVPKGCAHGFLTLEDHVEAIYLVSALYSQSLERGARWDDPQFGIQWPFEPEIISDKDRNHPDYKI